MQVLQKFVPSSFKVYLGTSSPPNARLASNDQMQYEIFKIKNKITTINSNNYI
jgi:hypothetical protein